MQSGRWPPTFQRTAGTVYIVSQTFLQQIMPLPLFSNYLFPWAYKIKILYVLHFPHLKNPCFTPLRWKLTTTNKQFELKNQSQLKMSTIKCTAMVAT
jgi:hypothetical protein